MAGTDHRRPSVIRRSRSGEQSVISPVMTHEQPSDRVWMEKALALAEKGRFSASPNPRVGCVIVNEDKLVGEGFHERAGEAHAEVHALCMAGELARGATAYVTLEPCVHHGRTPPCTNALIDAGIARVVLACRDPNPLVAGRGIARLEKAGITVTGGILQKQALRLNRAFFHRMATARPWVTLKIAASMDGCTALANGASKWITGAAAREDVHRQRLAADGVLAGTGSVIGDDARLTARYDTTLARRQPLRIVVDSLLKTPPDAAIFQSPEPILIATLRDSEQRADYPPQTEILRLPATEEGKPNLALLLEVLGERELNQIFVEAGARLAGAFIARKLADEILLYQAPTFLGKTARKMVDIPAFERLSDRMAYVIDDSRPIGKDWRFTLLPSF